MDGDYEISGKVLILPIVGKGRCKINIGNIIINIMKQIIFYFVFITFIDVSNLIGNIKLKSVLKNGNKHLEIVNISWTFTASKLNLKFDNLFNGDKALGNL